MEGAEDDRFTQVFTTKRGRAVRAAFRVIQSDRPYARAWQQEVEGTPFARVLNESIVAITLNPVPEGTDVTVKEKDGKSFSTGYPPNTEPTLLKVLEEGEKAGEEPGGTGLKVTKVHGTGGSSLLSLLTYILPFVLFFGFWIFLMNQMQGGGSRVMNFGKSKAKRMSVDAPKITFRFMNSPQRPST